MTEERAPDYDMPPFGFCSCRAAADDEDGLCAECRAIHEDNDRRAHERDHGPGVV